MILSAAFYKRSAPEVARELLGKLLVYRSFSGTAAGMIVETEAYMGEIDKACHAWHNRSSRTEIMFHDGGVAYVYLIYGMYYCFNVVTGPAGEGDAVLIRALEPIAGLDVMQRRRGAKVSLANLCRGPGKLCQALGITKNVYGADLRSSSLVITDYRHFSSEQIGISKRLHIDYAEEARFFPWRFYVKDNPYVSKITGKDKLFIFS